MSPHPILPSRGQQHGSPHTPLPPIPLSPAICPGSGTIPALCWVGAAFPPRRRRRLRSPGVGRGQQLAARGSELAGAGCLPGPAGCNRQTWQPRHLRAASSPRVVGFGRGGGGRSGGTHLEPANHPPSPRAVGAESWQTHRSVVRALGWGSGARIAALSRASECWDLRRGGYTNGTGMGFMCGVGRAVLMGG